jgi:hypothetical protein
MRVLLPRHAPMDPLPGPRPSRVEDSNAQEAVEAGKPGRCPRLTGCAKVLTARVYHSPNGHARAGIPLGVDIRGLGIVVFRMSSRAPGAVTFRSIRTRGDCVLGAGAIG